MKGQKHNEGELATVTVKIEKELAEALERMAKNSGLSADEIVCVALKRYKSHHADYDDCVPRLE